MDSGKGKGTVSEHDPRRPKHEVPSYARDASNETPSQTMARNVVKRRKNVVENARLLRGNFRNGRWFDAAGRLVATAKDETAEPKWTKPRRLGTKGVM